MRLERAHISYSLAHFRVDTVAVQVAVPGERWEIEFFADGSVDVEVFSSLASENGGLEGEAALERLFADHAS